MRRVKNASGRSSDRAKPRDKVRQGEEALRRGKHLVDPRLRDAVIDDIEETDIAAGSPDLAAAGKTRGRIGGEQGRDVDDRDFGEGGLRPLHGIEHCCFHPTTPSAGSRTVPGTIGYRSYTYNISNAAAAIDLEGDAGDELGVVGGEVERGIGDVARRREAAERNRGFELGTVLRRVGAHEGAEQRRLAGDRAKRVDADIVRRELDRHGFGHDDRRALRGVVDGEAGTRPEPRRRGGVDDDAALALAAEQRHDVQRREIDRLDVDGEDLVDHRLGHFEHRHVAMRDAGIVDHDIELREARDAGIDQFLDLVVLGDVAADIDRAALAVRLLDLGCHALAAGIVDIVDDDLRPLLGETLGDALAETRAAAGDDRYLARKTHDRFSP